MLKEGCSWRALDVPDIAWQTVYGHFRRWAKAGLWDQAMQQMKWRAGKDLGMVDATHIKVHRDGAMRPSTRSLSFLPLDGVMPRELTFLRSMKR